MRGKDKLLEPVHGLPVLRLQTTRAMALGLPVLVTLGPDQDARRAVISDLGVTIIEVPDAGEGMAASLRRAALERDEGQPMIVLLPDVPGVRSFEMREVWHAFRSRKCDAVVRGTDPEGRPGTPLCLPSRVADRFVNLTGDEGGRTALTGEHVHPVPFPDDRATRDLDTPEDWAEWRQEHDIPD